MGTKSMEHSRIESICKEIHDSWSEKVKDVLIPILYSLTQSECKKVRDTYKEIYKEDLLQLDSPFTSLMLDPFERDADVAREAFDSNNDTVNYKALLEIFTCRKSIHVDHIHQAYFAKYSQYLDNEIANIDPQSPYQKILKSLSASHKSHYDPISSSIAQSDAKGLFETGEGKLGPIDEAFVLMILQKRSIAQLKLTFLYYKQIYGHSYTNFLKNGHSGKEFEDAVKIVAKCIFSPVKYYAKTMYECLKGTTVDYCGLVRIIMSRLEVDMDEIERRFEKKYNMELKSVICESIPEGNQRDFLVALVTKIPISKSV